MPDLIIRDKLDKILLNIHFGLESCHSEAHANLERLKRLGLSTSVSLRANRKCFCDCPVQDCLLIHQEAARKEASSDAKKRKKDEDDLMIGWGKLTSWNDPLQRHSPLIAHAKAPIQVVMGANRLANPKRSWLSGSYSVIWECRGKLSAVWAGTGLADLCGFARTVVPRH